MQSLDFETLRHVFSYLTYQDSYRLNATGCKKLRDRKYLDEIGTVYTNELCCVKIPQEKVTKLSLQDEDKYYDFHRLSPQFHTLFPNLVTFDAGYGFAGQHSFINDVIDLLNPCLENLHVRCIIRKSSQLIKFTRLKNLTFKHIDQLDQHFCLPLETLSCHRIDGVNLTECAPKLRKIHLVFTLHIAFLPPTIEEIEAHDAIGIDLLSVKCPNLKYMGIVDMSYSNANIPQSLKKIDIMNVDKIDAELNAVYELLKRPGLECLLGSGHCPNQLRDLFKNTSRIYITEPTSDLSMYENAKVLRVIFSAEGTETLYNHYKFTAFPVNLVSVRFIIDVFSTKTLELLPVTIKDVMARCDSIIQEQCDVSSKVNLVSLMLDIGEPMQCVLTKDRMKLPPNIKFYYNRSALLHNDCLPLPNLILLEMTINDDFTLWNQLPICLANLRSQKCNRISRQYSIFEGYKWIPEKIVSIPTNREIDETGLKYVPAFHPSTQQ